MNRAAQIYVGVVLAAGATALAGGLRQWQCEDPARFALFLGLSLLTAGLKVRLPGVAATMTPCFFFTLIGIVSLSLAETLVAACSAVLVQCVWHAARKLRLVQLLFNIAGISLAVSSAWYVYHIPWLHTPAIEYSILLLFLAGTYYLAQTLPVAAIIALTESKSIWKTWRESYLWSWPYYLLGAASAGLYAIANRYVGWQTGMLIVPVSFLVYRSYAMHTGHLDDERRHAEEVAAMHLRMIESLATAIEAKDKTTHHHLKRVETYAVEIAKHLGLSGEDSQALRAAALLHDIGKIAVPELILNKPGRLTAEEFEKMKLHPTVGADIVERARFPYAVAPIVRCHHERWDGSGYPSGLKGKQIPIGARILAAVDCLDALASDRQYRRALPLVEAMRIVAGGAGTAFDPEVVAVLQQHYIELEILARVQVGRRVPDTPAPPTVNHAAPAAGLEASWETSCEPAEDWRLVPHEILAQLDTLRSARCAVPQEFAALAAALSRRVPFAALVCYTRQGDILFPEYSTGSLCRLLSLLPLRVGQGVSGWVAESAHSILNANPSVEPSYRGSLVDGERLASALAVPILTLQRKVAGVLALYRAAADAFTRSEMSLVEAVASSPALVETSHAILEPAQGSVARLAGATSCQPTSLIPALRINSAVASSMNAR